MTTWQTRDKRWRGCEGRPIGWTSTVFNPEKRWQGATLINEVPYGVVGGCRFLLSGAESPLRDWAPSTFPPMKNAPTLLEQYFETCVLCRATDSDLV